MNHKIGVFNLKNIFEHDRAAIEASVDLPTLFETTKKFHEQLLERSEELVLRGLTPEALQVLRKKVEDELVRRARAAAQHEPKPSICPICFRHSFAGCECRPK